MSEVRYLVSGDCSVCVEFGNEISPEINKKIRAFKIAVEKSGIEGIVETVPTYRSLLVYYKPEIISFREISEKFEELMGSLDNIEIPPDIQNVAEHNGKTVEEVIRIHTSEEYLIYMIGFIAGFPYLGGMSKEIATPRLKSPRVKIDGGSVGIAGEQTGVYPVDSPGGWQLIGRTPLKLYDAEREKPVLLEAGQYIKFKSVTPEEYDAILKAVEDGSYRYVVYDKEV